MTSTWIIKDWMGNDCFVDDKGNAREFKSFGDARDFITEHANATYPNDEEAQDGLCEDLYAINVDENGNELPDEGQYAY